MIEDLASLNFYSLEGQFIGNKNMFIKLGEIMSKVEGFMYLRQGTMTPPKNLNLAQQVKMS